jgi:hypothetical protein
MSALGARLPSVDGLCLTWRRQTLGDIDDLGLGLETTGSSFRGCRATNSVFGSQIADPLWIRLSGAKGAYLWDGSEVVTALTYSGRANNDRVRTEETTRQSDGLARWARSRA